MGLAETRAAADFATTTYPPLAKDIQSAAGFSVPIEVRWDTLAKEGKYVTKWKESWPKLYFQPTIEALRAICVDDLGKAALKEKLTKIVIQNTHDSFTSHWATFSNGVLTLDTMFTNVDAVADRTTVLREMLEKML